MLELEELMCELSGVEDQYAKEQGLPPGFRFHPTDEELITFYLASKVFHGSFCGVNIAELDLNRCEPWELPEVAKMGEREWYFYSLRDRKYPTGLRTNRATGAGYWKATGKDREVYSASNGGLLGMKKTLVFYKGRAPRGEKTKWVMHEYRLDGDFSYRHSSKEEWVICRIFHKNGDKKYGNGILPMQHQHLNEASLLPPPKAPTTTSLPLLLDPLPTTTMELNQTSPFNDNDNYCYLGCYQDLKSLITPLLSTTTTNTTNKKPLLSFQDQQTSLKKCKTESNFQVIDDDGNANLNLNLNWVLVDRIPYGNHQTPLFCEIDRNVSSTNYGTTTTSPIAAAAIINNCNNNSVLLQHETSTSVAVNRDGFHMIWDPPQITIRDPPRGQQQQLSSSLLPSTIFPTNTDTHLPSTMSLP